MSKIRIYARISDRSVAVLKINIHIKKTDYKVPLVKEIQISSRFLSMGALSTACQFKSFKPYNFNVVNMMVE